MIENFDCNKCLGLCCFNPPELLTINEVKKAISLGGRVLIIKHNDIIIGASIEKNNGKCPFLNEVAGRCKIYDKRFMACKSFECKAKKENLFEISNPQKLWERSKKCEVIKNEFYGMEIKEFLKIFMNMNFKFVSIEEYIEANLKTDLQDLIVAMIRMIDKDKI